MLFQESYLPREYLPNLKKYHYQAVDDSFMSKYFYKHFWNWAIDYFPMWIAPNVITYMGFTLSTLCYILLMIYTPLMDKPAPSWVYIYMGIAAFFYIHFDAMDGKQARRTGTSSPLGQLVDHGCDCINLTFMVFMFWSVYGLEISTLLPIYACMCYAVFMGSTWEEFHTGLLYLGPVNGPVEGTTILSICSIISGVMGRQVWDMPVYQQYRLKDLIVASIGFSSVVTLSSSIVTVLRKKGITAVHDLLISFAPIYCGCWWIFQNEDMWSPSTMSLFVAMMGLMTSNVVSRIVVNHVTHQSYPRWTAAFLPVILGCIVTALREYFPWMVAGISNHGLVIAGYIWVIVMQLHYQYVIYNTVSRYLGIRIFTITPKTLQNTLHIDRTTPQKKQATPKKTPMKEKSPNAHEPKHEKTPIVKRQMLVPPVRQSPRLNRGQKSS